jgi:hypothetical protein
VEFLGIIKVCGKGGRGERERKRERDKDKEWRLQHRFLF